MRRADLNLSEGRVVGALNGGQTYRYLGINQSLLTHDIGLKKDLEVAYLSRLRRIWSTQLSVKTKINLTNIWAVSLYRYYFGCLSWTREEVRRLDLATQKILRQCRSHHYNALLERIYLSRSKGGRGLTSLESWWERSAASTVAYVANARQTLPSHKEGT